MIPTERSTSVQQALQEVFGKAEPEEIVLLQGGSHSKIYKIQIAGKNVVLRVMDLNETLADREDQISCFQSANTMNIAPHCYYADATTGIILMQYISSHPINVTELWLSEIATTLSLLHAKNTFPERHQTLFDYIDELIQSLQSEALSATFIRYFNEYEKIKKILKPHLVKASCHNDLNSKNLLFDGMKTYLIDWEAAGMEDPFFDLGTLCNEYIPQENLEQYFLSCYFGRTPSPNEKAKVFLMRQVSHCYLAVHYLLHARNAGLTLDNETFMETVPRIQEWEAGHLTGRYALTSPQDFLLYGAAQIKGSLTDIAAINFDNAIRILKKE